MARLLCWWSGLGSGLGGVLGGSWGEGVVDVDLCGYVDGENWYSPEPQGRWAGPGLVSQMRLPPIAPGAYRLTIEVVDAIEMDVLTQMRVELAGVDVGLRRIIRSDLQGRFAAVQRWRSKLRGHHPFPVCVVGVCHVPDGGLAGGVDLSFHFPFTKSPAERGENDMRDLAVRFRRVVFEPV